MLSEDEVLQLNSITKRRAYRYIAAAERDWLYPERFASTDHWKRLGDGYLLMPEPRHIHMGGEIMIGYSNGRSEAFSEYGHKPWQQGYKDVERNKRESEALYRFQAEWALKIRSRKYTAITHEFGGRALFEDSVWKRELAAFKPVMYTGSESPAAKDKAKQEFVSGRSRVMLISLRSGIGLDGLQAICNTLVVGELDWSPQVIEQLIWRLRRLCQTRWPVNALIPYSDGGADPAMAATLGLKAAQSRGIVDPLKGVEQPAADDSRIRLLAQRYLEMEGRR